jgi:hypothetical protein
LEVSIEAIADRCRKLKNVVEDVPPSIKQLQMVLQGSVRLQVNAGPLEIANTFLRPESLTKYPKNDLFQLQSSFKEFLNQCEKALKLNKTLIKHDQFAYQEDLEKGFEETKKKMEPYLAEIDPNQGVSTEQVENILDFVLGKNMTSVKEASQKRRTTYSSVGGIDEIASFFK